MKPRSPLIQIAGLAMLCGVLASTACGRSPDDAVSPSAETDAKALFRHNALASRVSASKADLVILGDSIAEGWPSSLFPGHDVLNLGVGGDRTENVIWRIEQYQLQRLAPKTILLVVGTNNMPVDSPDAVSNGIIHVVSTIRLQCPTTKIVIVPILPRGEDASILEGKRTAINNQVVAWARKNNASVADVGSALSCGLKLVNCPNYKVDHLHLTLSGYEELTDQVAKVVGT